VVSQAEGVGCRIENAELKNASSGSNVPTRSALYPTRKTWRTTRYANQGLKNHVAAGGLKKDASNI